MNRFYVYAYSDQNDIPFYVGKGSGRRFNVSCHSLSRHPFLRNKIRRIGVDNVKVHFLHENLIEKDAFQLETFYIKRYGRRDLGEGTLCNLTNGGEGSSGYVCSMETRQKMKNNQNAKGHIHSEETKRKISKARKGKCQGENNPMYGKRGKDAPMYGKHLSKKTRQKLSEATKGKNNSMYGKHHFAITKEKISKALGGKNHYMYGKKHSERTKKKISKSQRLYYAKRKKEELV